MLVTQFLAGPTNCYVVAPGAGEQCVVIDPGMGAVGPLEEVLATHRLHPVAVILTHGHFDHTFSVLPVCDAKDVPAYIHPADRHQLADPWSGIGAPRGTPLFGRVTFAEPSDVIELADGQRLELAGLELTVRLAPGHTPGSVVFGLSGADEPVLFSGDLLFEGSIELDDRRPRARHQPVPAPRRAHRTEDGPVSEPASEPMSAAASANVVAERSEVAT